MWLLKSWFESGLVLGCLSLCLYVMLSCVVRGLCDELITRPKVSYHVSNKIRENSKRIPWPHLLWSATVEKLWRWEEERNSSGSYPVPGFCFRGTEISNSVTDCLLFQQSQGGTHRNLIYLVSCYNRQLQMSYQVNHSFINNSVLFVLYGTWQPNNWHDRFKREVDFLSYTAFFGKGWQKQKTSLASVKILITEIMLLWTITYVKRGYRFM
jgi:hypothetical protein